MSIKSEVMRYPLTYGLILLNTILYIFSALLSQNLINMDMQTLIDMGALYGPYVLQEGEWWRVFTAMFLHGGMTHLFMNMFSLYIVGRGTETYFNKNSYIGIYLFSGLIGGLVSLFMHPESVGVGASGAIFGVFGALAGYFLAHRKNMATHTQAFMKDFAIIIVINLVIGFSIPSVDVSAHLGGLVVGFVGGFILSQNPKLIFMYSAVMIAIMILMGRFLSGEYVSTLV